jgi:hypothetical protein
MTADPTPDDYPLETCIRDAVRKIDAFLLESTGKRASQQEIAGALTRYFVLKEILDFIRMERG